MKFLLYSLSLSLLSCGGEDLTVGAPATEGSSDASREDGASESWAPKHDALSLVDATDAFTTETAADTLASDMHEVSPSDAAIDAPPPDAHEHTVTDFPGSTAMAYNGLSGVYGPPFSVAYFRTAGDYMEDSFSRASPGTFLNVSFRLDDQTQGCAIGKDQVFIVKVDGAEVGIVSFKTVTPVKGERTVAKMFTVILSSGKHTVRVELKYDVCSGPPGGGSFAWRAGGSLVAD